MDPNSAQIWFEPVSSAKATRAVGVLNRIAYISPNVPELMAMSDAVRRQQRLPPLVRPAPALSEDVAGGMVAILPHLCTLLKVWQRSNE